MSFAAILCASRISADSPGLLRANLHFAGQSLVEYQARQASRAGATRILILVTAISPFLSQAVDRLGADGIAVALIRDMVTLVRDAPRNEDIVLLADGAMIAQAHFDAIAQAEDNVLLVTDDSRASAPFERIDSGQRWAGLARISPALLFGTLDMIGDWDLELTLVRAAVQAGARRITVPQDDLMEGRVALVDGQQQADLVAQAMMTARPAAARVRGGLEQYLLVRMARMTAPMLMRAQVPALQVRVASMGLSAVALVPIELGWVATGFLLLLAALTIGLIADRLDELALRQPAKSWPALVTPLIAIAGIGLAGGTVSSLYLMLLLGVLLLADSGGRTGFARPWMVFTPGSALVVLLLACIFGPLEAGLIGATILAIASAGAILLRRPVG